SPPKSAATATADRAFRLMAFALGTPAPVNIPCSLNFLVRGLNTYLAMFQRWQDPAWKRGSVSVR
uniref:hypothetical protein n=1 Tax=Ideonella azotifigens TaxID=513160 RepID=UPI001B86A998